MFYTTHIFLGPSLDLDTAKKLLPQAHYHPPIQCGDIIRVLRLDPQKIIIIDGFYATVPAVWHKEILLALELGLEIWGAASMGALRAAELYQYGMRGFGKVFDDFKSGLLQDDDEVAVLHHDQEEQFKPINDAMVNIRATCDSIYSQNLITLEEKEQLLNYCKSQFFPNRSLQQALNKINLKNKKTVDEWLIKYGVIDVKKKDTIALLEYHRKKSSPDDIEPIDIPINEFLKELSYHANLMPLQHSRDWLPPIEKQLQNLYKEKPYLYMLNAEIAHFTRKLFTLVDAGTTNIDNSALINYMKQNSLYTPEEDFSYYKQHPTLYPVYSLICQFICLERFTSSYLESYLPIIAHYYGLKPEHLNESEPLLGKLLILILATHRLTNRPDLLLNQKTITHYLAKMMHYRKYSTETFKEWYHPAHFDRKLLVHFLVIYIKSVYFSYTDNQQARHYFKWIYDAYSLSFNSYFEKSKSEQSSLVY